MLISKHCCTVSCSSSLEKGLSIRFLMGRAVHGSGGSGFCPTRNRPVTVTSSSVQVADEWWSVSGELDYHQNDSKRGEISPNPARSC